MYWSNLEVCAFGDDVANPLAGPLECAEFFGGEVRKDEDDQFGWKARAGLERHGASRCTVTDSQAPNTV